jgi:16S rRNA (guanine(966)-N(2))-methyltransferase RsmD
MRIIGGKYKSKRFKAPKSVTARPTTDFAKEGLFNILDNKIYFEETSVLDLFSGIGAISLEFASRGCMDVTLVEKDRVHIKFINRMIQEMNLENEVHSIQLDVYKYLKTCARKFDLIFADPPYYMENVEELPTLILEKDLLNPNGILVFEHYKKVDLSNTKGYIETRNYGNVNFSFFEKPSSEEE